MTKRPIPLSLWSLAAAALVAACLFQARVILSPAMVHAVYLPDDGYYYLALARNFWRLGY